MKVLVACEESQAVTIELRKLGIEAWSNDIKECTGGHPEWHIVGDAIKEAYSGKYDMMIAHPPCTYLSNAAVGYYNIDRYGQKAIDRWKNRIEAAEFFLQLWRAPIEKICIENPVGFMNSTLKANQIIHPYYFGDSDKKRTCFWLKGLPPLQYAMIDNLFLDRTASDEPQPTYIDKSGKPRYFTDAMLSTGESRQTLRSKTFKKIAEAMAEQWGRALELV